MKILHVTKRYPNSLAGDSVIVWQLAKHQRANGDEVQILTTKCKDILDAEGLTKVGIPIASASIDTINIKRILTLAWMVPWSFWYLRRVKPDIIHSHTSDFGFAISFAARFYRIPRINTCHGVAFAYKDMPWLKRQLEILLLKGAGYKIILTVDKNSLPIFAKVGIHNARFVNNAIDQERFTVAKPYKGGRFELFFVGHMEYAKGVPVLLDALAGLDKMIDWRLRMVGPGSKFEEYKALTAKMGLADRVEFLGRVLPEENARLYASSHAFVLPSLHEGFPIVLLEAWAAGLPVIITKVGTMTTVCKDGVDALLIDPGSTSQLIEAIERVIGDASLRTRLAENGRVQIAKKYTFEILSADMKKLYKEAMA